MRRILIVSLLCITALMLAVSCQQEIHEHSWDDGVVTARPSCVSIGAKTFTCTSCGETRIEILDKTGHSPGEAETKAPGCLTPGFTRVVCTVCGSELSRAELPAVGHEKGESETVLPTCEEKGCTRAVCTRCGEEYIAGEVPALGHSFSMTSTVKAPACETSGEGIWTCSVCSKTENREIPPLGHEFESTIETIPSTCIEHGSSFSHCSRCNQALWHELPLAGHTWDGGDITTFPTCAELGVRTYTCTYCGGTETEDVPMTEHSYVYDRALVPATCVSGGTDVYSCLVCGHEEERETEVNPFNHSGLRWEQTLAPGLCLPGSEKQVCDDCETETGEVRRIGHLSREGYWTSQHTAVSLGPNDADEWYELNVDASDTTCADFLVNAEFLGGTMSETVVSEVLTVCETNPDPEHFVGALKNSGGMIFGVVEDGTESFTLRLPGADGESYDCVFTRISDTVHTHSYMAGCSNYDESLHMRVTDCTEHDAYMVFFEHEWEDEVCVDCGADQSFQIILEDGNELSFVWATKDAGYVLSPPAHGNTWEIPGQSIYYDPGSVYYPSGEDDYLRSCELE